MLRRPTRNTTRAATLTAGLAPAATLTVAAQSAGAATPSADPAGSSAPGPATFHFGEHFTGVAETPDDTPGVCHTTARTNPAGMHHSHKTVELYRAADRTGRQYSLGSLHVAPFAQGASRATGSSSPADAPPIDAGGPARHHAAPVRLSAWTRRGRPPHPPAGARGRPRGANRMGRTASHGAPVAPVSLLHG